MSKKKKKNREKYGSEGKERRLWFGNRNGKMLEILNIT